MNRITYLYGFLPLAVAAALLTACSGDDNPVDSHPPESAFLWVHLGSDSIDIQFADLAKIDAGGEEAVQLSEFVDTVLIPWFRDRDGNPYDARVLYSYQIVADDGFSASENRGYPNNIWAHMHLGHILTETRQVVFPDDKIDLAGAYNVKEARHIYVHRKFDLVTADGVALIELRECTPTQIENFDGAQEPAVCLGSAVAAIVTNPQEFTFKIRTLDGFGPSANMTWEQFQTGHWLMTSEKTKFSDTTLVGGAYRLRVLKEIELVR